MAAPLKVALVVHEDGLDEHHCRVVEWAGSTHTVRSSHLIVQQQDPPAPKPSLLVRLLRSRPSELAALALWRVKARAVSAHDAPAPSASGGSP